MEFSKELMAKAKNAQSSDALLALAKENGMEMTQEEANSYFAELHKTGELSDQELENVTGGGCRKNGHPIVTIGESCDEFLCKKDWNNRGWKDLDPEHGRVCHTCGKQAICKNCYYCHYESALWLCYCPKRQR